MSAFVSESSALTALFRAGMATSKIGLGVVGHGLDLGALFGQRRLLGGNLFFNHISFRLVNGDLLEHDLGVGGLLLEDRAFCFSELASTGAKASLSSRTRNAPRPGRRRPA